MHNVKILTSRTITGIGQDVSEKTGELSLTSSTKTISCVLLVFVPSVAVIVTLYLKIIKHQVTGYII